MSHNCKIRNTQFKRIQIYKREECWLCCSRDTSSWLNIFSHTFGVFPPREIHSWAALYLLPLGRYRNSYASIYDRTWTISLIISQISDLTPSLEWHLFSASGTLVNQAELEFQYTVTMWANRIESKEYLRPFYWWMTHWFCVSWKIMLSRKNEDRLTTSGSNCRVTYKSSSISLQPMLEIWWIPHFACYVPLSRVNLFHSQSYVNRFRQPGRGLVHSSNSQRVKVQSK